MTTIQKTLVGAALFGALAFGFYLARQAPKRLAPENAREQEQRRSSALSNQIAELQRERDSATSKLAKLSAENETLRKNPSEVLKLRGEVGRLRQENTAIGSTSALSKITANAESRKMLRDQQKVGMTMIYRNFARDLKLTPEQTDRLNDLLADHIMENVGHVTTILRDKPTTEDMDRTFAAQDTVLRGQLLELLGQDGLDRYQEYTQNLFGNLTTDQFSGMLSGSPAEKEAKTKQFRQVLREESLAALTSAGLPADYQTIPMLNFRNIASEAEGEKSLKLLDDIFRRAATKGAAFLNAEDLKKFEEFRSTALNVNRSALMVNRTVMAPIAD